MTKKDLTLLGHIEPKSSTKYIPSRAMAVRKMMVSIILGVWIFLHKVSTGVSSKRGETIGTPTKKGLLTFHQGYTDIICCIGLINYNIKIYDELLVICRIELKKMMEFIFIQKNVKFIFFDFFYPTRYSNSKYIYTIDKIQINDFEITINEYKEKNLKITKHIHNYLLENQIFYKINNENIDYIIKILKYLEIKIITTNNLKIIDISNLYQNISHLVNNMRIGHVWISLFIHEYLYKNYNKLFYGFWADFIVRNEPKHIQPDMRGRSNPWNNFRKYFYVDYGISRNISIDYFIIERNLDLELKLYKEFKNKTNKKYIIINDDVKRNLLIDKNIIKIKNVEIYQLSNCSKNIFDIISIIENSEEIHTISTFWSLIIYQLQKKYNLFNKIPIYLHNYVRPGYCMGMYENHNWKIIN